MNYNDLQVWQESMLLVTAVYKLSSLFPNDERYGLTDQMRRAAVSIPSNIAEGHARNSKPDFARFLRISLGSCTELETQIIIAKNLEYVTEEKIELILNQSLVIRKMLTKLISTLA
jgi:four helix bundle protein